MLEIRGLAEYKAFSGGSGRSRKGEENQGAGFSEMLHVGGERKAAASVPDALKESDRGGSHVLKTDLVGYDVFGKRFFPGMEAGRNLDVEL